MGKGHAGNRSLASLGRGSRKRQESYGEDMSQVGRERAGLSAGRAIRGPTLDRASPELGGADCPGPPQTAANGQNQLATNAMDVL